MVNYNYGPTAQPMPNQPNQPQVQNKPSADYSSWINPSTSPVIPQIAPTEQRGITVSYMVQSKSEYASIYPPAGQTVAIFNFPDHELCLKAKDIFGIDLGMRTFDLRETTPMGLVQGNANQNSQIPASSEPQVTKAEFDELKESLNSLIKELKG